MTVRIIKNEDNSENIFNNIKGKRFLVVSIDKNHTIDYFWNNLSNYEIIFLLEYAKQLIMNEVIE